MRYPGPIAVFVAATLIVAGVGTTVPADDTHGRDKALREIQGTVTRVERTPVGDDGDSWLVVTLADDSGETSEMRVAPVTVLEDAGFELAVGDRARAQVFVDESPHSVARFRNIDHGTTLRLRCLHGEPIWGHPGFAGGQRDGAGGARVRRRGQ